MEVLNRITCANTERQQAITNRGRSIMETESAAIARAAECLSSTFASAIDLVLACRGRVIVSGMGKAGLVGRKISASLSSTGTPSFFLHPAEAVHGDLGSICPNDIVLLLSNSGETEEVTRLLPTVKNTDCFC